MSLKLKKGKGYLIIPRAWYQKLVNQNGRSDWLAIAILGEVALYEILYFVDFEEIVEYFCQLYGVSRVCTRRALKRLYQKDLINIMDYGPSYRWEVPEDMEKPNSWSINIARVVDIEIEEADNEISL